MIYVYIYVYLYVYVYVYVHVYVCWPSTNEGLLQVSSLLYGAELVQLLEP